MENASLVQLVLLSLLIMEVVVATVLEDPMVPEALLVLALTEPHSLHHHDRNFEVSRSLSMANLCMIFIMNVDSKMVALFMKKNLKRMKMILVSLKDLV